MERVQKREIGNNKVLKSEVSDIDLIFFLDGFFQEGYIV